MSPSKYRFLALLLPTVAVNSGTSEVTDTTCTEGLAALCNSNLHASTSEDVLDDVNGMKTSLLQLPRASTAAPKSASSWHTTYSGMEESPRSSVQSASSSTCYSACYYKGQSSTCHDRVHWLVDTQRDEPCGAVSQVNEDCTGQCTCTPEELGYGSCKAGSCTSECNYKGQSSTCHDRVHWLVDTQHNDPCGSVSQVNDDCEGQCSCTPEELGYGSCKPEEPFDVIIIGAGLAGSVVAGKLAKDLPTHRILLLEAGRASQKELGGSDPPASWDYRTHWWKTWSGDFHGLTRYDVPNNYESLNSWNSEPADVWKGYPGGVYQCKILGGCDVMNGALRQIPNRAMFDAWPEGWKWTDMEKYYDEAKKTFNLSPTPSTDGKHYNNHTGMDYLEQAMASKGFKTGYALTPTANAMGIPVVSTVDGVRQSTAEIYLPDAMKRPNFTLHIASEVTSISMRDGRTATGVSYTKDNTRHVASIKQNGIVVLAAGVMGTVKLLLASGIQNGEVGKGISDHGYRSLAFRSSNNEMSPDGYNSNPPPGYAIDDYNQNKIGPLTQFGPTFVTYQKGHSTAGPADAIDVEAFVGAGGSGEVSMGLAMLRPTCSSADLYLQGSSLKYSNNHLYTCEQDNKVMSDAALFITQAMKDKWDAYPTTSPEGNGHGAPMDAANHFAGGCSLGRCLDPKTMLVLGTTNVAVVDSSLFPTTIWCHPSFTCAVTAAKAADILAQQLRNPTPPTKP